MALDARYHQLYQRKLYKAPQKGLKIGGRSYHNVDEAMSKCFSYLEENSEECQFSFHHLLCQVEEKDRPDYSTVKAQLFQRYGEEIVIAETANRTPVVCFKDTGYKICTHKCLVH